MRGVLSLTCQQDNITEEELWRYMEMTDDEEEDPEREVYHDGIDVDGNYDVFPSFTEEQVQWFERNYRRF